MEPRMLDLLDLTVSQSVLMLHQALEESGPDALDVAIPPEEMLRDNLLRLLAQRGRAASVHREDGWWRLSIAATGAPVLPLPSPAVIPAPVLHPTARPLVLTRDALGHARSGAGRRLLVGVLRHLDRETPWVVLTLDALLLLEDPEALAVLHSLRAEGVAVHLSREGAFLAGEAAETFEVLEDVVWQRAVGGGEATVL